MAKTFSIDLSDDRLISIAADMVDSHNYISALKMLNKNAGLHGSDEDALMLYAEIFDDMGLYEKSVNGWFRYLDTADAGELADCYEGLAIGFMNLGNEHFSAFYYNKLLMETDEIDGAEREEIIKDFLSAQENPLKFVYPPALADCSEFISSGIEHMKAGEYDLAVEDFDKVAEGNPKYSSARNYVAMCKIIADKTEEAEQECLNLLKFRPDDVQALTTLAAVKTEEGKTEEARELAKRLLSLGVKEPDEVYKIATVCCENKMHEDAYSLFCGLGDGFEYDLNVLYFKAVSAFNAGMIEESFEAFDRLVTIYPDAVTAKYYYNLARKAEKSGDMTELSYFYRLPAELRESSLKVLAAYMRLSSASARKFAREVDLSLCVQWCFDEREGKGGELQLLACQVAVKAEMEETVRGLLLDAFLDDRIKLDMLTSLAERNVFDCFGVVICNVYRRVTMRPLTVDRAKKKYFVRAYARLLAHFAILDDGFGEEFAAAAEEIYVKLAGEGRLDCVKNVEILTAAVYLVSKVRAAEISGDGIYEFFEVTKEQVNSLIGD